MHRRLEILCLNDEDLLRILKMHLPALPEDVEIQTAVRDDCCGLTRFILRSSSFPELHPRDEIPENSRWVWLL